MQDGIAHMAVVERPLNGRGTLHKMAGKTFFSISVILLSIEERKSAYEV